jgi:hypothetical protein
MYKILGGDQKEYGPVTADQVREWLAQRRVNGQTMVQAEGSSEWRALSTFPEFAAAASAPPGFATARAATVVADDNPMSAVVPYKNPKALIAYYLAIFSLIPCLGLPLGIAAFILGIAGLKVLKTHPNAHGKVHAWIGIILGGLCGVANLVGIVLMAFGAAASRH